MRRWASAEWMRTAASAVVGQPFRINDREEIAQTGGRAELLSKAGGISPPSARRHLKMREEKQTTPLSTIRLIRISVSYESEFELAVEIMREVFGFYLNFCARGSREFAEHFDFHEQLPAF